MVTTTIWVECYPDKLLVKALGYEARHARGKGRVIANTLKGGVGLVDLDYEDSISVKCREDGAKSHREIGIWVFRCGKGWLIALERTLEVFLIASAKEIGMDLESYDLSEDAKELHSQISRRNPSKGFYDLLGDLRLSKRFKELANVLSEIMG